MEFSTIGAEDSLDEAKVRLEMYDALVVWGKEKILGILLVEHLVRSGNCGSVCELDVLVDPLPDECAKWQPKFVITTDDGEPITLNHGP
ncbi:MAG: hypothetical protein HOE76_03740 [Euryarchaeota archaeon]|jgi:hypothetical protein|nr:hypothetical protein [Euryarchaeota archaeon]MBT4982694.1 hypothetical protein [Euryarchaeota archaeon]MBT5183880.1 hypothetical protein [Euryarchaeota archaeon]